MNSSPTQYTVQDLPGLFNWMSELDERRTLVPLPIGVIVVFAFFQDQSPECQCMGIDMVFMSDMQSTSHAYLLMMDMASAYTLCFSGCVDEVCAFFWHRNK